MSAGLLIHEFAGKMQGWCEDHKPVRVVLVHPSASFDVMGTILCVEANGDFSVAVDDASIVAVSVARCVFGFLNLKAKEISTDEVESGIVAVRPEFELTIMLLAQNKAELAAAS